MGTYTALLRKSSAQWTAAADNSKDLPAAKTLPETKDVAGNQGLLAKHESAI
jgi:hypothetical protein